MANNVTLSGILNANDLATDGANFAGAGNVRFDEYIVNVDRDGTTVTLEIDNAALVIDAPDITNGSELTQPVVLPAGTSRSALSSAKPPQATKATASPPAPIPAT